MGSRGPIPKPIDERLGHVTKAEEAEVDKIPALSGSVAAPELGLDLHPLAADWYASLAQSAQARFYEPSDWQVARIIAQSIHDYMADSKRSSMKFAATMAAMTSLLVTEGDRRRVRMEIDRTPPDRVASDAKVSVLDRYRRDSAAS